MEIKELITPFFQKVNGVIRKICYHTLAKVVFLSDGTDVETKLNALSNAVSGQAMSYVVDDIAARDAIAEPHVGDQAWVKDASADDTVEEGAAKYIYESADKGWVKTAEANEIDVVHKWENIQGKPTNTVADIDAAVTATKMLANHELTVSEDTKDLLLDGKAIGGKYGAYVTVGPEDPGFEAAVAALNLPDGAFFTVVAPEGTGE